MTIEVPSSPCRSCGREMSGATDSHDPDQPVLPKPGEISICLYCSHVSEYGPDLKLVPLSDAALLEIAGDPRFIRAMRAVEQFRKMNGYMP
jgi:hypothetical protein